MSDPQGLRFEPVPFPPLEERHVDHHDVLELERVVAYLVSTSSAAALPERERSALRDALLEAIAPGEYRLEIDTHVYDTSRL